MKKQIPAEALWFRASVDLKTDTRRFEGVAYSGKVLSHWLWDQLAIDLDSLQLADKIPALVEHDRAQRAGVASLAIEQNQLIARGTLLSNEHGQQVAKDADEGFPWQMSVHVEPSSVERFDAGAETEVNGQSMTGPLHVFRNAVIREVSFTPTGVDNHTRANVLSSHQFSVEIEDFSMSDPNKTNPLETQLAALQEKVSGLEQSLASEKTAREQAEKDLAEARLAQRESAIAQLAEKTGKQFSQEDKDALLKMDEAAFQLMAKHLEAARPALPEQLFSTDPTPGAGKAEDNLLLMDCEQRYGGRQ